MSSGSVCNCFRSTGAIPPGAIPQWSLSFALDVLRHAILPALAIILGSLGGWALGMRAMMVTTQGEDYVTFAEAKGLKDRTIFVHYGIRNAMLPQATALALSLGQLVSGAVLVEIVFGYPGHRHAAVPGNPGLRLLPGAGNCFHRDRRRLAWRR